MENKKPATFSSFRVLLVFLESDQDLHLLLGLRRARVEKMSIVEGRPSHGH